MNAENLSGKMRRILVGVYSTSMGTSMGIIALVAAMEVFMLGYSVVNASLYREFLWSYRAFYICLLVAALVYIALSAYVKRDVKHRYRILAVADPIYLCLFFAWALGITFFDMVHWGEIDSMVFMTFSLVVPLCFFVLPQAYIVIAIVADALMVYLALSISSPFAVLTNLSIYCVFQTVLGFSFLRLRMKLAERILEERRNADIDRLTGFFNRRAYDRDVSQTDSDLISDDLVYMVVDLNGLKEANDVYGHEVGDRLIVGATECMRSCFGARGNLYRMGGDEFVALIHAGESELPGLIDAYDTSVTAWSKDNGITLSTALGCACSSEFPGEDVVQLSRIADRRMYTDKARYYEASGRDRRRHRYGDERAETEAPAN